jgi:hypothetical protein
MHELLDGVGLLSFSWSEHKVQKYLFVVTMIITGMTSNLVEDLALEYVGNATSEDQF